METVNYCKINGGGGTLTDVIRVAQSRRGSLHLNCLRSLALTECSSHLRQR